MKATNLKEALNRFDPERPLSTATELSDYFIARPLSPLRKLQQLLESVETPQKILFSGHRGTGKSSELAKLTLDLGDHFFVVRYSVKSILNLFDLTYVDVLLSLALELVKELEERKVSVPADVLTQVLGFATDITEDVEIEVKKGGEVGAELNLLVGKLSAKLGPEEVTRRSVREKVAPRLSDLLDNTNLLAQEIQRVSGKRVVVVVEDLDKVDLAKANELFYEHASALSAVDLTIIYTFPIALRHDNNFVQVKGSFCEPYILPNLKTVTRAGAPDPQSRGCLQELLLKRIDDKLVAEPARAMMAEASGGIPRELIALARSACLEAMVRGSQRIEEQDVAQAVLARRRDYQILLEARQRNLLRQIHASKAVNNDPDHRALLHNLSVLEFRNDDVWYDVHPVVIPLLTESS